MQRKTFKSRLFKKNIKADELDYWKFLYSEILFRLNQITDLNCPCGECMTERIWLKHLLTKMEEENHIPQNRKASKLTGIGDCGRTLGPVA